MPSSTFTSIPFSSLPETFPTAIADNDPIHHSSIPHYLVNHPIWYFADADLFFSQRGFLFGLHQQKFDNSYFSRRLLHIEPCRTAATGTLPSLPIPIDTLSLSTFISFIRLLYQPSNFKTDVIGWNHIKDLAMTWGFVDITLLAMQEIQTIDSERCSTIRRLPLQTTVLVKYWEEEIIDDNSASQRTRMIKKARSFQLSKG